MICHPLITATKWLCGVNEQTYDIDVLRTFECCGVYFFTQQGDWLVQARCINKHDLRIRSMMDSTNSGAGGLRLIRNDGDLDSTNRVYKRGLANVGSTNKGYKSAAHSYRVVTNATDCAKKNSERKFQSAVF